MFRLLNGSIDQSESRNKLVDALQQVPAYKNQDFNNWAVFKPLEGKPATISQKSVMAKANAGL